MQTLQELQAAKEEIEAKIAAQKAANAEARNSSISMMKQLCAEHGITARDLFEPVKLDPVYRGPNGETDQQGSGAEVAEKADRRGSRSGVVPHQGRLTARHPHQEAPFRGLFFW